ncbi:RNA polymerase sigma factor [Nonomuraea rubra]|uniref:RNA polymerase sigma factor n=1 Tax=Nonomuraea rubra TaxID=46180 RepID=UPI0033C6BAA3
MAVIRQEGVAMRDPIRDVIKADDAALIERSLNEPEIFAVLFDRHARYLHRYVVRRLGPSEAVDVVADTFLTAFQRRGDFDQARADARPWLYGIASNLIGKHRRTEMSLYRAYIRRGCIRRRCPAHRLRTGSAPWPSTGRWHRRC